LQEGHGDRSYHITDATCMSTGHSFCRSYLMSSIIHSFYRFTCTFMFQTSERPVLTRRISRRIILASVVNASSRRRRGLFDVFSQSNSRPTDQRMSYSNIEKSTQLLWCTTFLACGGSSVHCIAKFKFTTLQL